MKIQRIDGKEFQEFGYLQEVNRRVLHPLGLALETYTDKNGITRLGGIWDNREDPEGMIFYQPNVEQAERVEKEWQKRSIIRNTEFGWMIQPPEHVFEREQDVPILKEQ